MIAALVAALPIGLSGWIARRLGDLAWALLPGRRRLALANLRVALPDVSTARRRQIARASFQHLGMVFAEGCVLLRRRPGHLTDGITVEGLEHMQAVFDRHGCAIGLTAHLGNWELLSLAPVLMGYPLTVVARALDSASLAAWADRLRRTAGVEVVDKRQALRPVLAALRRGRMVGVLLDQNTSRREGVFVPFFGRLASTSRGVALLALRTGTPVVPVFATRIAPGRHRVTVHPPLPMPEGKDDEAVLALTARCTAVIEEAIRATPEQWLWAHDRWRTRPADERR